MRPTEVLDAIGDLHNRLADPGFAKHITYMAAHHMGRMSLRADMPEKALRGYAGAPKVFQRHVEVGDPYRVSHDMSAMVEWMATQLDGTDQVMRALAPSEAAVVCFDKPLRLTDIRGEQMLVHWMVWGPGNFGIDKAGQRIEPGTVMWLFNDTWREMDQVNQFLQHEYLTDETHGATPEARQAGWETYQKSIGRWSTIGCDVLFDGQRVGDPMWNPAPEQAAEVLAEGFTPTQGTNTVRLILALWMLLGQTITVIEDDRPDRPSRRRALRKGLPAKVSVVRLRREINPTLAEGETQVEWSHRWIVKRHPRWQPYGSRACTSEAGHSYGRIEVEIAHRGYGKVLVKRCVHSGCQAYVARIFIEAYEKGPEGAPLVITDKVYSLDR